jgi:putative FmdB family regulatory protein
MMMTPASMMPKYSYRCSTCGKQFEIYHSMFETIDKCIVCEANSSPLCRLPASFTVSSNKKAGGLVDEFIRDAKEEIKTEKTQMRENYDND